MFYDCVIDVLVYFFFDCFCVFVFVCIGVGWGGRGVCGFVGFVYDVYVLVGMIVWKVLLVNNEVYGLLII